MAANTGPTWDADSVATNPPTIPWAGWTCHIYGATRRPRKDTCLRTFKGCKRLIEHYKRVHLTPEQTKAFSPLTKQQKAFESQQQKWEAIWEHLVEYHFPEYKNIDPALLQANITEQQS